MAEIKSSGESIGTIQIADEVISIIAGTAALEVEGVAGMTGNFTGDIAEILGKKNLSKGITVEVTDDNVIVAINVQLRFGYRLQEVSINVQKSVKNAIETMTGLVVVSVNVNVTGVLMEKEKAKEPKDDFIE